MPLLLNEVSLDLIPRLMRIFVFAILFVSLFIPANAQTVAGCPSLPANNVWNVKVNTLPIHTNSSAYKNSIGLTKYLHADFGSGLYNGGPIGIPFDTVPGTQAKVAVAFDYADESDPGPYPIPANAQIEGGSASTGDRHVIVVDQDNCVLYEMWDSHPQADGSWHAGSGAKFDLRSNALRPNTWTSADAAGMAILPGLVRYDEVASGVINHAIRFTAPQSQKLHIWPARHDASTLTGTQYPPMGVRFRLRAGYDVSTFSFETQVILTALKNYGMILADNGSSWFISGAPDSRWNNTVLRELHTVLGSDFEAVDESSLMVDPNSGQAAGGTTTAALGSISLAQSSATGPATVTGNTVSLTAPAPTGGALVSLSSSNAAVSVPASVTVAEGATSVTFTMTAAAVSSNASATITATYAGVSKSAAFVDNAPVTTVTITKAPSAGSADAGSVAGGSYADLAGNDNVYWRIASSTSGKRTASATVSFSGVAASGTSAKITYSGSNTKSCSQSLSIYNVGSNSWQTIHSATIGSTETLVTASVPSPLSSYVSSSGQLQARIRCTTNSSFTLQGDFLSLQYLATQ